MYSIEIEVRYANVARSEYADADTLEQAMEIVRARLSTHERRWASLVAC
jgi:hypothetical protein